MCWVVILGKLKLNWESIFNSYVVTKKCNSNNEYLYKIISDYESVSSDELGTLKDVEIEYLYNQMRIVSFFKPALYHIV